LEKVHSGNIRKEQCNLASRRKPLSIDTVYGVQSGEPFGEDKAPAFINNTQGDLMVFSNALS
jgi:hypothetical protein